MLKESLFTFISRVVVAFTGFLMAVITARALGVQGRGIFAFLDNLIAVAVFVGNFGLGLANVHFLARKKYSLSLLFWNSVVFGLLVSVLLVGGIQIIRLISSNLFQQIPPLFTWIILLSLPLHIVTNIVWHLILGLGRFFTYNIIQVVVRLLALFILVGALMLTPIPLKASIFVLALGGALWLVLLWPFLAKFMRALKPELSFSAFRSCLSYGVFSQIGQAAQFLLPRFGIFAINFFYNPKAVGLYSVAVMMSELLNLSSYSLATVLLPKTSSIYIADSESERLVEKACRLNLFFLLILGGAIFLSAPWLIRIFFGESFLDSLSALRILLLAGILGSFARILGGYILGKGLSRRFMFSFLPCFLVAVALNFLLVPLMGINGSALATLIASALASLFTILVYKMIKPERLNFKNFSIPTRQDLTSLFTLWSKH